VNIEKLHPMQPVQHPHDSARLLADYAIPIVNHRQHSVTLSNDVTYTVL
jgi:hypothetical protein